MKKLLYLAIVVLLLVVAAPVLADKIGNVVHPTYTLLDTNGNIAADIWVVNGEWFVFGSVNHFCPCVGCVETLDIPKDVPTNTPSYDKPTNAPSYDEPTNTPRVPTNTPEPPQEQVFCHCEQGEGEGAEGRKNCHVAKYNNGHARHEWDYWSTDGTCDGWHH